MQNKMIKKFTLLFFVLSIFIFSSCAYRVAPNGGPIDREAPFIIATYPTNNTTNFKDNYISVEFSEYIDKVSFRNSFYFSPALKYDVEISWTGTTAYIYIQDTLKPNQTYTLTFTKNISDYNNKNKMLAPYILKFSTGNTISDFTIKGEAIFKNFDNLKIWAYDLKKDYNPLKFYPDYSTQVDNNGQYTLTGMNKGIYRVIAVNDKNNNNLYDQDEEYGVFYKDIILENNDVYESVNFIINEPLVNKYEVNHISKIDDYTIKIDFKNNISQLEFNKSNFNILDSLFTYPCTYLGLLNGKTMLISANNKFKSQQLKVIINTDTLKVNTYNSKPFKISPANFIVSKDYDIFYKEIKVTLPFFTSNKNFLSFFNLNNSSYNVFKIDDLNYIIKFDNEKNKDIVLNVNFKYLPTLNNDIIDTTVKFTILPNKEYICQLKGEILSMNKDKKLLNLISSTNHNIYSYVIDDNQIKIFNLPQDKFIIAISEYHPSNKYYFGKVFPFVPSLKFSLYNDTLKLNKRWPVVDYKVNYIE
jgi:hypothetical protein